MDISVIIPTFKPGDYLDKCLSSILQQTELEIEIIIILNGPRDPYYDFIQSIILGKTGCKVSYIEEVGVSAARNYGVSIARGKYVTFIDDDDIVSENYLEKLFKVGEFENDENIIVQANFKGVKGKQVLDDYISTAIIENRNKKYNVLKYRKLMSSVCGKLFRTTFLKLYSFNKKLSIAEDALLLFTMSKDVKSIVFANEDCIYYRNIRENSVTTSKHTLSFYFKNYLKKGCLFSFVYFKGVTKYNFLFYSSRMLAISKVFLIEIKSLFLN